MELNSSKILSEKNFIKVKNQKKRIVICDTFNNNMKHYEGWKLRNGGEHKKTAPYTISKDGTIYEHFNPEYQSYFFTNTVLNNSTIVILLENDNYLIKDDLNNQYITWLGYIYKDEDFIFKKDWRNFEYWLKYSDKQLESATYLINYLSNRFQIPIKPIETNVKSRDFLNKTIIYRSNFDLERTDVNPSWNIKLFNEKLTKHEEYIK